MCAMERGYLTAQQVISVDSYATMERAQTCKNDLDSFPRLFVTMGAQVLRYRTVLQASSASLNA